MIGIEEPSLSCVWVAEVKPTWLRSWKQTHHPFQQWARNLEEPPIFFHVRFLRWQTSCVFCPSREQGGHKIRQVVDQRLEFQVVYIVFFAFEATTNWLGWSVSGRFGWFCGCLQHEKTQKFCWRNIQHQPGFSGFAMVWCILAARYVQLVSLGWSTVKAGCSCIFGVVIFVRRIPRLPSFQAARGRWIRPNWQSLREVNLSVGRPKRRPTGGGR